MNSTSFCSSQCVFGFCFFKKVKYLDNNSLLDNLWGSQNVSHKRWIFGRSEQLGAADTDECSRWHPNDKRAQHQQGGWVIDLVGMRKGSRTGQRSLPSHARAVAQRLNLFFWIPNESQQSPVATCIIPDDSSTPMTALAWPRFQPVKLPIMLRTASRSWGLIEESCPVDKAVLSFPSAEIVVESMVSPKFPAKAAETYTGSRVFISSYVFCQPDARHHGSCTVCVHTWGSRSEHRVVKLYRTIILCWGVSCVNAGPGATHRHKSGSLEEQQLFMHIFIVKYQRL